MTQLHSAIAYLQMISTVNIPDKPDILKSSEKPNRSMASLHEYSDITDTARYNVGIPFLVPPDQIYRVSTFFKVLSFLYKMLKPFDFCVA